MAGSWQAPAESRPQPGLAAPRAAGQTPEVVVPSGSSSFGSLCCSQAYLPSSSSATGVGEPSRVLQVALRVRF